VHTGARYTKGAPFKEDVLIANGEFTLVSAFTLFPIKCTPVNAVDFGVNSIYEFPELWLEGYGIYTASKSPNG